MAKGKKQEVPKEVIAAVLVLAILVSIVGTWLVLDEFSGVDVTYVSDEDQGGKVQIGVKKSPVFEPVSNDGQITLGVK